MATTLIAPTTVPAEESPSVAPVFSRWRLLAIGTATVLAIGAAHAIVDIDIYWHLRVGNDLIATHSIRDAGSSFAFTLPGHGWVTTQWLSEVVLATVYNLGGLAAISVLRILLSVALLAVLGRQLLRGRRTVWGPIVFAVTACTAAAYFQERPQLFSLFFLVWLAGVMRDELVADRRYRMWAIVAVTWLWANVHGMWVMVSACYLLLAVGWLVESCTLNRKVLRAGGLAVMSTAVAVLTPAGPSLLVSPISFARATPQITEWQPTSFHSPVVVAFGVLVLLVVTAWVRGGASPVSRTEMVFVAGMFGFAMVSMRDVPPAAILLAPIVLSRLESSFPRLDRIDSHREGRVVGAVSICFLLVGLLGVVMKELSVPVVPGSVPRALAERIALDPGPHRVLDDYNASGAVILWGGAQTQVAIDGRADRYGAHFIADYTAMMTTVGQWQEELDALAPDYALLDQKVPLVRELVREGWTTVAYENKWVLLHAPGSRQ